MKHITFTLKNTGAQISSQELLIRWTDLPAPELLEDIFLLFGRRAAIGTSFQKTGVVTIHLTSRVAPSFRVFTIDTGRLFPETHTYMKQIAELYKFVLEVYSCDEQEVQKIIEQSPYREFLFLENQRLRKLCCHTRKVLPRNRALKTVDVWISGVRQDQSEFRSTMSRVDVVEIEGRPIIKVLPLFDWTEQDVDEYIKKHEIPVHPLYAKGYRTIGCQLPCSTTSLEDEVIRAGRWRWEQDTKRECALHLINGEGI